MHHDRCIIIDKIKSDFSRQNVYAAERTESAAQLCFRNLQELQDNGAWTVQISIILRPISPQGKGIFQHARTAGV